MSQKNVNKFLAGAVTATMVATAVVTPAMAASFTDTGKLPEQIKGEVDRAVELGYFQDSEKFNPAASITRGQVALVIARQVSGVAANDIAGLKAYVAKHGLEEKVTPFADVKKGETELYYASLIVKDAGAFTQDSLNPASNITRSQMAKVVVTAFDLKMNEDNKKEITDIDKVSNKEYIEILASNGVTEPQNGKFNPGNNVTRSQMASFLVRAHDGVKEEVKEAKVESVSAINAKTLKVEFNQAVDTEKAKLEVVKSTIKQNVSKTEWAADGKSVTLELSAKLNKGEYTVNVTGLTDETLTKSVQVEDEKVDSIEILSDIAVVDNTAAPTSATVAYQVKNQYGEDITKTTNLTTNHTGITIDPAKGLVTLGSTSLPTPAKVGDKVAVALVHAESAKSATKVVTLSASAAASEVAVTGVYNKDKKELNEGVNLTNDAFYLLVDAKDQYGNAIIDPAVAKAGLIKSESNPTIVTTKGANTVADFENVTIDGKKHLALRINAPVPGGVKAGENQITLISTTTGKNVSYKIQVAETTRTDAVTLSAPALAVANEDILVPATVLDKDGKAVTDLKVLNHADKGVKVTFKGASVPNAFTKDKDGNVFIKVAAGSTDGTFPLVAQSSTFKVATQTIKVEKAAVAKTVRGLKNPLALAAGKNKTITVKDVVVEDQYGREMTADAVTSYLNTNNKGILVKKADASATVVTLPSELQAGPPVVPVVPASNTIKHNAGVVVTAGSANGTQTLQFVLADDNGTNEVAASTAESTVRVTDGKEYDGYEIAEIGKVQASDVETAGEKAFTVNGLLNGGKVALDGASNADYTATISGGKGTASVTDGKIDVKKADLNTKEDGTTPIDTEFTLKVTINATGEVLEQKFTVSAADKKVEDFFFTTTAVQTGHAGVQAITEAVLKSGSTVASGELKAGSTQTVVTLATTDQYGNKAVVAIPTASTVTIVPEKASEVSIVANGTKDAAATLVGVTEAKATIKVKVGNATKELKVTLIP